jgi:5'-methylthioadenosine phosphorylase
MTKVNLAVIGGTGFYDPQLLKDAEEVLVETAYGKTTVLIGGYKGIPIAFLTRHGKHHELPPHRINYRANVAALKKIGITRVLSSAAVGSLKENLSPGTLVVIDQFIDMTKSREHTFYDGEEGKVVHTDFTEPYCPQLREQLRIVMSDKKIPFVDGGTYLCTEGPRYESPGEIKAFALWGADVVGMTNLPEVTLAREAGLCYSCLSLVTNYAAGISPHPLTHKEVAEMVNEKINLLREIFLETLISLPEERECRCWYNEEFELGP